MMPKPPNYCARWAGPNRYREMFLMERMTMVMKLLLLPPHLRLPPSRAWMSCTGQGLSYARTWPGIQAWPNGNHEGCPRWIVLPRYHRRSPPSAPRGLTRPHKPYQQP
jgi:hypothetical protein